MLRRSLSTLTSILALATLSACATSAKKEGSGEKLAVEDNESHAEGGAPFSHAGGRTDDDMSLEELTHGNVASTSLDHLAEDDDEFPRSHADEDGELSDTLTEDPLAEDDEGDTDDTAEEDFCPDDLYATYLKNHYLADYAASHKKAPERRSAKRRRGASSALRSEEREALFFARSRLNGPLIPYFGAIPVEAHPRVDQWVRYFKTHGRKSFMQWLVRGESIKNVVHPLLKKEGLPPELFYLAMVESGFNNSAYSKARATGTWQFMKGTARLYGLNISPWLDERRDPVKSTIAAARYLRDLYKEFGHWYLAMAAYNAGPGRIQRMIKRVKSRDFWEIAAVPGLAEETKNYVPKVLAALILASDPKTNGFDVSPNPADALPDATVTLPHPTKLDEIAAKLQIPTQTIRRWNPELTGPITPPPRRAVAYELRLPTELAASFPDLDSFTKVDVKDVQIHRIGRGETLGSIARHYRVPIREILVANPQLQPKRLKIGQEIAIPIPAIVSMKPRKKDAA